jgi:hypothetical protein
VEDGRDQAEVATAHRVSWPTVQRAVVAHAAVELVEPEPVRVLGMDETRFGRPRWEPDGVRSDGRVRWTRSDPWETGFVDIIGGQGLLGQVDGRTSADVKGWLSARTQAFRDGIEVVVIDPHAGYAAAVRAEMPDAVLAVDHFHLVMLANKAVTAVRQRVTREQLGRRGRASDPAWANRRLLLRGHERLSQPALARMWNGCVDHDSTGEILTAWIAKEELRALCALAATGGHREDIARRLWAFYSWCADADIGELTTLAQTIETWWPAIEVFLTTGLTNACPSHCTSWRCFDGGAGDGLTVAGGSDIFRAVAAAGGSFLVGVVEARASAVDAAPGDQTPAAPGADHLGGNAEPLGDLVHGEHAARAQPLLQGGDVVVAA